MWWIRIGVYSVFLLSGQSAATLLGRLYFERGGNSKWMATLVQTVGFPILIPYYFYVTLISPKPKPTKESQRPSKLLVASIYVALGLIIGADCYLYSVGLMYIPVSTYSLICASQLAFNALFSYFLNSQKFTPFIVNSLFLLTLSSVLLVFGAAGDDESGSRHVSRAQYVIGFACTVGASAGYGLVLSLTQFFIDKVLKRDDFRVVMDMILWPSLVASVATLVGLFASGDWAGLGREMGSFRPGEVSYVMNLAWTAVTWQVYSVGMVGLIIEVSSLFSNVIGVLGLPIVPVFAVLLFGEKMDGVKAVAMVLAVWGFASYAYQNYLEAQGTVVAASRSKRTEKEGESSPEILPTDDRRGGERDQ